MFDFIEDYDFTPLDEEQAEFLVSLAIDMKVQAAELPEDLRSIVEVGSNNLLKLTAMTMAAYYLYDNFKRQADNLHDDLGACLTVLRKVRPESAEILRGGAYDSYIQFLEEENTSGE